MEKLAKRIATYEDLLKLPDHLVAEIVDGELFTAPRPSGPHERAGGGIYAHLRFMFDDGAAGARSWWIAFEAELHLGGEILVPDVSGWRRDRHPSHPVRGTVAAVAPDFVCEVISPSTGRTDRMKKLPAYARVGVAHAWIVEPSLRTLEVYRLDGRHWTLRAVHGGDEPVPIEPFETIEFPLDTLWFPEDEPA